MLQSSSAAQIEIDRRQEFFYAQNLFRSLNDLLRGKEIPVKSPLSARALRYLIGAGAHRYHQESAGSAEFTNRTNL
jgi:hypothetical protein